MFSKFIKFLQEEYSETLTQISQTDNGNVFVVNDNFYLINMDRVADDFTKSPNKNKKSRKKKTPKKEEDEYLGKGRDIPSTVDGLYISKDLSDFYFIEFKKMKLEDAELPISYSFFKKTIDKNIIEKYDDFSKIFKGVSDSNLDPFKEPVEKVNKFLQAYHDCQKNLDDKTKNSLKIKPLSTMVLLKQIYNQFKNYEEGKLNGEIDPDEKFKINEVYNNFKEDPDTLMTFSNINFHYYIVYEFGFLTPNKSHKKKDLKQYFKFLKNINPYPFNETIPSDEKKFVNNILPKIKL